jgi:hypothetical protein
MDSPEGNHRSIAECVTALEREVKALRAAAAHKSSASKKPELRLVKQEEDDREQSA